MNSFIGFVMSRPVLRLDAERYWCDRRCDKCRRCSCSTLHLFCKVFRLRDWNDAAGHDRAGLCFVVRLCPSKRKAALGPPLDLDCFLERTSCGSQWARCAVSPNALSGAFGNLGRSELVHLLKLRLRGLPTTTVGSRHGVCRRLGCRLRRQVSVFSILSSKRVAGM